MIIALSGPSGIGKGYFKDAIKTNFPNVKELVWYTTRKLRPSELKDSNRKHVPSTDFSKMDENEELALVQNLYGYQYAIKKADLLRKDGIFLTEFHPYILEEAKKINPKIIAIGMTTDDMSLLKERLLEKRKTESPKEVGDRLSKAKGEMSEIYKSMDLFNVIIKIDRENESRIAELAKILFEYFLEKEGNSNEGYSQN